LYVSECGPIRLNEQMLVLIANHVLGRAKGGGEKEWACYMAEYMAESSEDENS